VKIGVVEVQRRKSESPGNEAGSESRQWEKRTIMNDYGVCVRLKTRCGLASKQESTITDRRKDKIFPKEESEERRDG
jgi:hypothetical protein